MVNTGQHFRVRVDPVKDFPFIYQIGQTARTCFLVYFNAGQVAFLRHKFFVSLAQLV